MEMANINRLTVSILMILILSVLVVLTCCTDIYENVTVEKGFEHYAEQPWNGVLPLNCLVNVGYIIVGFYWLKHQPDNLWIWTFAFMSIMYGPIQFLRILTQKQGWSVLDQWVTLPIFAWVFLWSYHIIFSRSKMLEILVMSLSVFSYNLSLLFSSGFEVMLCIHIISTFLLSVYVFVRNFSASLVRVYILAALSLLGFMVLKTVDHELLKVHPLFSVISGHFLSKICDFMQIHYACGFMEKVHQQRMKKVA